MRNSASMSWLTSETQNSYALLHHDAYIIDITNQSKGISRGWDVIWRDLFVQIELGVDIALLGIK